MSNSENSHEVERPRTSNDQTIANSMEHGILHDVFLTTNHQMAMVVTSDVPKPSLCQVVGGAGGAGVAGVVPPTGVDPPSRSSHPTSP